MTSHLITSPSQDLVRKWIEDWAGGQMKGPVTEDQLVVAAQAARWGADQELEGCCEWLRSKDILEPAIEALRAVRRPKPPSLKEQALIQLSNLVDDLRRHGLGYCDDTIRRALELLSDD